MGGFVWPSRKGLRCNAKAKHVVAHLAAKAGSLPGLCAADSADVYAAFPGNEGIA